MQRTVIGTFDTYGAAEDVVHELVGEGYGARNISILAPKPNEGGSASAARQHRGHVEAAMSRAAAGGMIGGAAGLFASFIWFVLPGVGQIAASGPMVVALTGATAGAVAGGLIAALVELGVPENHAKYFTEALRRGVAMVTLRCEGAVAERAAEIMCDHGAVDIERRAEAWRKATRWAGHSPSYAAGPAGTH